MVCDGDRMGFLAANSTVSAGLRLRSHDGRAEGRLGLLVVDEKCRLFGISVLALAATGSRPEVRLSTHWEAMGPARALDARRGAGSRSAESLLALIEIPKRLQVTQNIPGVGNVGGLVDPLDPFGFTLHIATTPLVRLGAVEATLSTLFLRDEDGSARGYEGVVEVACPTPPPAGFAGALVTSASGDILGTAVGADRRRIYVAPLAPILAAQGLHPLAFGGGRHNEHALELQAREREQAERAEAARDKVAIAGAAPEAAPDSEEIFKKYPIESIIPKQAA